jgi:hypothetical protein
MHLLFDHQINDDAYKFVNYFFDMWICEIHGIVLLWKRSKLLSTPATPRFTRGVYIQHSVDTLVIKNISKVAANIMDDSLVG